MKMKLLSYVSLLLLLTYCQNKVCAEPLEKDKICITIDGGSATKKSPISQAVAEKFNLIYLEVGTLYRTVVYMLMQREITPDMVNENKIDEFLKNVKLESYIENRVVKFVINEVYLSPKELRSEDINASVAEYTSRFKSISDFCIKCAQDIVLLKEFREFNGIIAEGRTCGMYIFPDADLKFWFTATNSAKIDFRKNVEGEIDNPVERDKLDFSRKFYQMVKPEQVIEIWTSSRTIEENIALVSAFIEQKIDLKKYSK